MEAEVSTDKGIFSRARDIVERLSGAEGSALSKIAVAEEDALREIKGSTERASSAASSAELLNAEVQNIRTKAEEASIRSQSVSAEFDNHLKTLKARDEESQKLQEKAQAHSKGIEAAEAEAKAHVKDVLDSKAQIKNQFTEISQFYGEIGDRKNELLNIKNTSAKDLNEMRDKFSEEQASQQEKNKLLFKEVEDVKEEIKSHLQSAVGVSLFSAFDVRKQNIVKAKWVWLAVFVLSVGLCIYWVDHIIKGLSGTLDLAFAVRTVLAALLGYFVYFCAKQYERERRAEEEYAFKSVTSLSLKPYHDLLVETKNQNVDDEFMKKMMAEIFDNPVKRLFAEGKSSSKVQINEKGVVGEHSTEG